MQGETSDELAYKTQKNTSANIWIPVSEYFIDKTFKKKKPEVVIHNTELLVEKWYQLTDKPLDIAFADVTSLEEKLSGRIFEWTNRLKDKGARNIILCDTRGIAEPRHIEDLLSSMPLDYQFVEFHPHDDNGCARANIEIAKKYGISVFGLAVYGAGERQTMIDTLSLKDAGLSIDVGAYAKFEKCGLGAS